MRKLLIWLMPITIIGCVLYVNFSYNDVLERVAATELIQPNYEKYIKEINSIDWNLNTDREWYEYISVPVEYLAKVGQIIVSIVGLVIDFIKGILINTVRIIGAIFGGQLRISQT